MFVNRARPSMSDEEAAKTLRTEIFHGFTKLSCNATCHELESDGGEKLQVMLC